MVTTSTTASPFSLVTTFKGSLTQDFQIKVFSWISFPRKSHVRLPLRSFEQINTFLSTYSYLVGLKPFKFTYMKKQLSSMWRLPLVMSNAKKELVMFAAPFTTEITKSAKKPENYSFAQNFISENFVTNFTLLSTSRMGSGRCGHWATSSRPSRSSLQYSRMRKDKEKTELKTILANLKPLKEKAYWCQRK